MGDILKKASIDISTAFDANKAQKDTARLKNTVEKTAEEIKNDRLKELALLFKEGKIDAEQLAALKKRVDASTFNNELAQEKRLHALKIKNVRDHAKLSERLGSAFNAVGSFAQNPGGAMGAAVSKIPGGVAVAAGFAALSAVTATLNKKIVDVSAGYEKQLNIIQSVTNASDEQRAAFTRVIGSLGASTQWSASDVARGYESLVRGGLTVDEANLTIRGAVDLATAQNVTIENAGELITTAAHQFGLDSSQSERISDVVTTALSGSAQNMEDFSEALKYSGVQLNSIGASIEQTSAMIMQLADVGVKGSSAGNALKNLAQRLNANRDKLEALGVSVIDAQGAFLSLPEILADIKEKTSTMSDSERGAKGELSEILIGGGFEYSYNDKFFVRGGYHHESDWEGGRKYATFGAGFKMSTLAIDAGYTWAMSSTNPLDKTIRVSLAFDFDGIKELIGRRKGR